MWRAAWQIWNAVVVGWLSIVCESAQKSSNLTFMFACWGVHDQCAELGWRVVRRRPCGWGYQSECAPPLPPPLQPQRAQTLQPSRAAATAAAGTVRQRRQLTVATVNICDRPYAYTHDGQAERSCRVPHALLSMVPDIDVIVLTEGFNNGCLDDNSASLDEVFKHYGFQWSLTPAIGSMLFAHSGVVVISRWPIVANESQTYTRATGASLLAAKGVVYASINKLNTIYHIFATHMQDGATAYRREVRLEQANQLAAFIRAKRIPSLHPVYIVGDLNADLLSDSAHSSEVFKVMNAAPPIVSADSLRHTYPQGLSTNKPKEWLDYVLYSRAHTKPRQYKMWSKEIKVDEEFRYCSSAPLQPYYVSPSRATCMRTARTKYLSDHLAVFARLRY